MPSDGFGFGPPTAITFGPGDFQQDRAVDEHISIAEAAKAAEIHSRATMSLLSEGGR